MEREMSVLCGVIEHLLPRVGAHVRTLDLAYGKAVTNEVVRLIFLEHEPLYTWAMNSQLFNIKSWEWPENEA